uniref:Major capsid protein n=2 Tax=unclassified bacterial viruses TaxID=12333 RepID=A0AAU7J8J6_9VIRU
MALIAPTAPVAAPARTALPYGLGSVLGWRNGDRFMTGVNWVSITCDPAGGRGGPHCDDDDVVGLPKDFTGERALGEALPFIVYGHDACNMVANSPEQAQEFATAHLVAREEARAEQALWTGDLGNTPNFSGANGYDAPVDLGDFADPLAALAAVEQGIAVEYGSLGVIHMSRTTATLLGKHLDKRGGRLYTRGLDTPVVAGAGYPDGQIIGTGALVGWRGDVLTSSQRPGDLLDRGSNTMYAIAEREYVIGFDPCPIVSATITEETP